MDRIATTSKPLNAGTVYISVTESVPAITFYNTLLFTQPGFWFQQLRSVVCGFFVLL